MEPLDPHTAEVLEEIENLVGRLGQGQREEVVAAIREHELGARTLAAKIAARGDVQNPAPMYLRCIRDGDHLERKRRSMTRERPSPHEAARRLFVAKLQLLRDHAVPWTDHEMREHALDYAIGEYGRMSGPHAPDENDLTLEADLRREFNVPRWHPTPDEPDVPRDAERDTPHRRAMADAYRALREQHDAARAAANTTRSEA